MYDKDVLGENDLYLPPKCYEKARKVPLIAGFYVLKDAYAYQGVRMHKRITHRRKLIILLAKMVAAKNRAKKGWITSVYNRAHHARKGRYMLHRNYAFRGGKA
jgi:hypothetical protein